MVQHKLTCMETNNYINIHKNGESVNQTFIINESVSSCENFCFVESNSYLKFYLGYLPYYSIRMLILRLEY